MNKILLVITGSIAASKCIEIFKQIDSKRFQISCILTEDAKKYIKQEKLKKYVKNRLFTDGSEKKNKMLHITLSRNNDLIFVCPATANSIAKFANGYGDNLASNTLLASNKKIFFVPAMNSYMWLNKANKRNIKIIKEAGHEFIGPINGNLKCGEYGLGRISAVNNIIEKIEENCKNYNFFHNKKCLVTAGPTIEMIDPIRYISNKSSGKQGYEIASQLALSGAKVILISGPTNLEPFPNIKLIKIESAEEMYKKIQNISNIDIAFFTAAVSDFKSKKIKSTKLEKDRMLGFNFIKNIDVLKKIGNNKRYRPKYVIGFAAETGSINNAKRKLLNKNCDMIVYNKINKNNKVFGSDYNKISIITHDFVKTFKKMTKTNCAKEIIKYVYNLQLKNE